MKAKKDQNLNHTDLSPHLFFLFIEGAVTKMIQFKLKALILFNVKEVTWTKFNATYYLIYLIIKIKSIIAKQVFFYFSFTGFTQRILLLLKYNNPSTLKKSLQF